MTTTRRHSQDETAAKSNNPGGCPMKKHRLNENEIKALAAKTGISERLVRVLITPTIEFRPSNEGQEFDEFLEDDMAPAWEPFQTVCSEHKLLDHLGCKGCSFLFELWCIGHTIRLLMECPVTGKGAGFWVSYYETYFVSLRNKLFRNKAWKLLPAAVRKDVEARLLTVAVEL